MAPMRVRICALVERGQAVRVWGRRAPRSSACGIMGRAPTGRSPSCFSRHQADVPLPPRRTVRRARGGRRGSEAGGSRRSGEARSGVAHRVEFWSLRPLLTGAFHGGEFMIGLLQRVSRASVTVDGEVIARIGQGLLVLVGVERGDGEAEAKRLAQRLVEYRVFPDESRRMNRSESSSFP